MKQVSMLWFKIRDYWNNWNKEKNNNNNMKKWWNKCKKRIKDCKLNSRQKWKNKMKDKNLTLTSNWKMTHSNHYPTTCMTKIKFHKTLSIQIIIYFIKVKTINKIQIWIVTIWQKCIKLTNKKEEKFINSIKNPPSLIVTKFNIDIGQSTYWFP